MIFSKKIKDNRIKYYMFGMKIFSYPLKTISFEKNKIKIHKNIKASIHIVGSDNIISVMEQKMCHNLSVFIHGNNNKIVIDSENHIDNLDIRIGNHFPINNSSIYISHKSWFGGLRIVLEEDNSKISISDDCVFSTDVLIRCGEYPHLIFEKKSGKYLASPTNLSIGKHVWCGEGAVLLTHSQIPSGCIVGTKAVVTKKFNEEDAIIAGNPAKICKTNIFWERDVNALTPKSKYYNSLIKYKKK